VTWILSAMACYRQLCSSLCSKTGRKVLTMKISGLFLAMAIVLTVGGFAQQAMPPIAVLSELSQPIYPPLARQANIHGDVSVSVTVQPDGKTEAAFESGHPLLKQAALDSAQKSRFECHVCSSPVAYRLVYSFRLAKEHDCCSAMSAPAHVTFEQPSSDQNKQPQTHITIVADEICLCDPASQLTQKKRGLKCLYLWKCS
jgi:TonB family protein